MKVTLKEGHKIVYQMTTHQIRVDIDGADYVIRQGEDDNGVEYHVLSDNLNGGMWASPHDIEDEGLRTAIEKLASSAYDDFIFSDANVGKEVDMNDLEDY